jgi:hypothetical protein
MVVWWSESSGFATLAGDHRRWRADSAYPGDDRPREGETIGTESQREAFRGPILPEPRNTRQIRWRTGAMDGQ